MFGTYQEAIAILSRLKKNTEARIASDAYFDMLYTTSAQLPAQVVALDKAIKAIEEAWTEEERKYSETIIDEGDLSHDISA